MNGEIKGTDSIGYADYLHIVFDKKCVEFFPDLRRELDTTFDEVLEVAKKNGFENGTILLVAESPLNGTVYRYGNYGDYWAKIGETMGYA